MRSFVAVDLSQQVISAMEGFVRELRPQLPGARWVSPSSLHLTLRFFGEVSEPVLAEVSAAAGSVARGYEPFSLELRGIGFFPGARRARVLWVGVCDPPETLMSLQKDIEAIARANGFEPERRRFAPHLTLARFRETVHQGARFIRLAEKWGQQGFGSTRVEEVVVYQSILRPKGAEYRPIQRLALGGG